MRDRIKLLLFNIMGIDFALDVRYVKRMICMNSLKTENIKKIKRIWFHERINFSQTPVVYSAPRALQMISNQEQFHLIIDNPGDMPLEIDRAAIHRFPALMEKFTFQTPMRGVCIIDKRIVLLIDTLNFLP